MEDTEPVKEWFVTHDGKQFGPVSMDDLKYEAERGELNPRLDMVWKSGMDDWIPAGEVDGLFKRNEEAKSAEVAKEAKATAFTEFKPEISEEEKKIIKGEWTGAGRGTFISVCCILPFLWMAGVGVAMTFLEGKADAGLLAIGGLVLCLVPLVIIIAATLQRFQNLVMSRAWFFGLFAPFLNLWICYRLFACPPGYAHHKKLDPLGWVLAILYWLSNIAVVLAMAGAIYLVAGNPEAFRQLADESEGKQFGKLVEDIRKIAAERDKPAEPQQKPAE